jgi:hypothetical protein
VKKDLFSVLFPFFIVITFAFVLILVFYRKQQEKKRTRQLAAIATQLGWNFAAIAPLNMISGLERFTLFGDGHGKTIRNLMYGEASGVKAAVFDYIYVTGYGKSSQAHYQSVVYFEPRNLVLPYFSLRPESFFHRIAEALGYQDIDFAQRPEFSKRYLLRGQDETAIRRVFGERVLSFYETYPGTSTDGGGNQLFLFRNGNRFQPEEIQSYVGLGLNLLNLFPRAI